MAQTERKIQWRPRNNQQRRTCICRSHDVPPQLSKQQVPREGHMKCTRTYCQHCPIHGGGMPGDTKCLPHDLRDQGKRLLRRPGVDLNLFKGQFEETTSYKEIFSRPNPTERTKSFKPAPSTDRGLLFDETTSYSSHLVTHPLQPRETGPQDSEAVLSGPANWLRDDVLARTGRRGRQHLPCDELKLAEGPFEKTTTHKKVYSRPNPTERTKSFKAAPSTDRGLPFDETTSYSSDFVSHPLQPRETGPQDSEAVLSGPANWLRDDVLARTGRKGRQHLPCDELKLHEGPFEKTTTHKKVYSWLKPTERTKTFKAAPPTKALVKIKRPLKGKSTMKMDTVCHLPLLHQAARLPST